MADETVAVAMSGGMDSSVAAALLREEGYRVIGLTMKLWEFDKTGPVSRGVRSCCDVESIIDAGLMARKLDIPHYVLDMTAEFQRFVVDDFLMNYGKGRTPNPCVRCNTFMKFDFLLSRAESYGCRALATGHYARIEREPDGGGHRLLRGVSSKDQSYALWGIETGLLDRLMFPLGELTKDRVRDIARRLDLPSADRDESQDVCFIPGEPPGDFVERRLGGRKAGEIVDSEGRVVGSHRGISRFTIGQRRGLGLAAGEPVYVTAIEPETNRIRVGTAEQLLRSELTAGEVNWVSIDKPEGARRAEIQIRYRHRPAPGEIIPLEDGRVRVRFDEPQRAVTPGQSAVFYDGDTVLGGGVIETTDEG